MPFVKAGPNQFLLAGRGGKLENRGSAVRPFLRPGAIFVLVPSTKQEATFEFTQETKDGIPLRFKGIVIYRITDPIAAARLFDFGTDAGLGQISTLLTHVCLGELRHAVSHMTMVECIEQRKTTLSGVASSALQATIRAGGPAGSAGGASASDVAPGDNGAGNDWGITVEVAQVAQVFIVDSELRQQLEAEVRNEIKLKSDQSDVRTKEEAKLTEMASQGRVHDQQLAGDQEAVRREEVLELARIARQRRMEAENLATMQQSMQLELERFRAEMEAEQDRVTTQAPVRRLAIETERELLREELELRRLQQDVKALDVETELLLPRAQQAMRREMLPLEQAPQIVESASKVLHGTNLSIYGEDGQLLGQLAPMFEILARAVQGATRPDPVGGSAAAPVAEAAEAASTGGASEHQS